jgi:hypothetical protein
MAEMAIPADAETIWVEDRMLRTQTPSRAAEGEIAQSATGMRPERLDSRSITT